MPLTPDDKPHSKLRLRLHEIIFESDTKAGRSFDVALIWGICLSVLLVMLESVPSIRADWGPELYAGEWFFTILFTLEFLVRLYAVRSPLKYTLSFYGMVDLLAIVPTYLSLFVPGAQSLLAVRTFRLLRIFRIMKLSAHLGQARILAEALRASRPKITVFLVAIGGVVVSMGAIMYLVEGEANGFTSIPTSIYWAIVTMTTVGFGDITPNTPLGQFLAATLMIIGYAVIAIPTGIITTELVRKDNADFGVSGQACPSCGFVGHDMDALFCKRCGEKL